MLITERFVMLNLPKSGSTFCRTAIQLAHAHRLKRLGWAQQHPLYRCSLKEELMVTSADPTFGGLSQHGAGCQIPSDSRQLKIMSVMRDPLTRLESLYRFGWWRVHLSLPADEVRAAFPHYPDISLGEYHDLEMLHLRLYTPPLPAGVGYQAAYFIRMYFRNPEETLLHLSDRYLDSGAWRADLLPVEFLRNDELYDSLPRYLTTHGFHPRDVAFIKDLPPENVSPALPAHWNEELVARVLRDERYLFTMLQQLGLSWSVLYNTRRAA